MLQNLEKCYKIWKNVRKIGKMLEKLEKCYKILKSVRKIGKMLEKLEKCYKILKNVRKIVMNTGVSYVRLMLHFVLKMSETRPLFSVSSKYQKQVEILTKNMYKISQKIDQV